MTWERLKDSLTDHGVEILLVSVASVLGWCLVKMYNGWMESRLKDAIHDQRDAVHDQQIEQLVRDGERRDRWMERQEGK